MNQTKKNFATWLLTFFEMTSERLLRRCLIALLSTLIFSLVLAWIQYTPSAEQYENVLHWSFSGLFFIFFLYSSLSFFMGGILFSFMADKIISYVNSFTVRYLLSLLLYSMGGVGLNYLLIMSLLNGYRQELVIQYLYYGISGALLFLHVSILVDRYARFK